MAFVETARWQVPQGQVAALVAGPREPDLVRWFDGALPGFDERQRRLLSGGAALSVAALVLAALAGGMVTGNVPGRNAAIEVLRLADPLPVRPAGAPVDAQMAAGNAGALPEQMPPARIPEAAAPPSLPPTSILRWSVQRIPRRVPANANGMGGTNGAGGTGAGGGGVYDPYAGAAPQRRSIDHADSGGIARPLPPVLAARLAEAARARLAPWNGLLRCTLRLDSGGRVVAAECGHRQGLRVPAALGARLIGLTVGTQGNEMEWIADL